jgi:hypothetical protein
MVCAERLKAWILGNLQRVIFLLNLVKIYQLVQKLLVGNSQTACSSRKILLPFLRKVGEKDEEKDKIGRKGKMRDI